MYFPSKLRKPKQTISLKKIEVRFNSMKPFFSTAYLFLIIIVINHANPFRVSKIMGRPGKITFSFPNN